MPYPQGTSLLADLDGPPRKMCIALSTGRWSRSKSIPIECLERTQEVARWLEQQGHSVEEVSEEQICDFEQLFVNYKLANWIIPLGNGIQAFADELWVRMNEENTSIQALQTIAAAKSYSINDLTAAQSGSAITTRQWGEFWERGYDLLLTPALGDRCAGVGSEKYALSSQQSFQEYFDHTMDFVPIHNARQ